MTAVVAQLAALGGWTYLVVALLVAADAVCPVLPAELAVLSAGALAASGRLALPLVLAAAAAGAVGGDYLSYLLGRGAVRLSTERLSTERLSTERLSTRRLSRGRLSRGRFGMAWLLRHPRSRRAVVWATRQLQRRAVAVLVTARFLPGGRTASTLSAGFLRVRPPVFLAAAALGGSLWAAYAAGLGYLAGRAAADRPWLGAAVAAAALALGWVIAQLARRRPRPAVTPMSRPAPPREGERQECSQSA